MNTIFKTTFLLALFTGLASLMQPTLAQDPADILKKAQANFEALDDFSANFSFTLSNPSDPSGQVSKKGKLSYSNDMYVVKMPDQEIYCDGAKLYIYMVEDNEVNILPNDEEEGFSMDAILKLYQSEAKARYDGKKTINGKTCYNIYLANADSRVEFNQARLYLDTKTHLPVQVELVSRTQTRTVYEFGQVQTNTGLTSEDFRFNVSNYPGIEVFDDTK